MQMDQWLPVLATAALAAAGGVVARQARSPGLGGMLMGLGLLVGLAWTFGALQASPRQLPERLPMLALGLLLPAALAARWPRAAWAAAAAAALGAGWWLAGAPLWWPDAERVAPVALALAAGAGLAMAALRGPWQAPVLAAGLALLLHVTAPRGPWADVALLLGAAGLAAAAFGRALPPAGWIALGPLMAAVAAGPVLAIGRGADWAVPAALVCAVALAWLARWPVAAVAAGQVAMLAAAAAVLRFG